MIDARSLRETADQVNRIAEEERAARQRIADQIAQEEAERAEREATARANEVLADVEKRFPSLASTGQREGKVMTMTSYEYTPPEEWHGFNRSCLKGAALIVYDKLTAAGLTLTLKPDYDPPSGYKDNNLIAKW